MQVRPLAQEDYFLVCAQLQLPPAPDKSEHAQATHSLSLTGAQVEQCFALRASSYSIQYKDDDGEVVEITGENDLTEAIAYFHAPADGGDGYSARDSMSIRSFQSRSQRKITLYFDVVAEYDGPSLSDASSISGSESDDRPSSELSFGLSELARDPFGLGREPEFDERTVSSRDRSSAAGPSLVSRASIPRRLPPIPSALPSIQGSSNAGSSPSRSESPYGGDIDDTQTHNADADDPTAVFARIKLQESLQRNNNSDSDLLRPVPHMLWIEQQRGLTPAAIMNSRLRGSRSSSALSSAPSGTSSVAESASGKLALQQDLRGKYYYTYTSSDPAASEKRASTFSAISGVSGVSGVSGGGDSLIDELSLYMANNEDIIRPERLSRSTESSGQSSDKRFSSSTNGLQRHSSMATSSSRHTSLIAHMSVNGHGHEHDHLHISPDIPPEVLKFVTQDGPLLPPPPDEQTDCSACGVMLDALRYVCTTCGEKRPPGSSVHGGSSSSSTAVSTAGPSRSLTPQPVPRLQVQVQSNGSNNPFLSTEERQKADQDFSYPPQQHRSPTVASSSSTLADPFGQYPKPLPAPPVTVPGLLLPTSPTSQYGVGSPQTPIQIPTVANGFELCVTCMEDAGVVHAMESTTALGVSHSSSGSVGGYPSSPLSATSSLPSSSHSHDSDAMSEMRRAAPSKKGQIRHVFVEKMWATGGWKDVEQDDNIDGCSICNSSLAMRRYKCTWLSDSLHTLKPPLWPGCRSFLTGPSARLWTSANCCARRRFMPQLQPVSNVL